MDEDDKKTIQSKPIFLVDHGTCQDWRMQNYKCVEDPKGKDTSTLLSRAT